MGRRCPRCSEAINLFRLRRSFPCAKCGLKLTSNFGLVFVLSLILSSVLVFTLSGILFGGENQKEVFEARHVGRILVVPILALIFLHVFDRFGIVKIEEDYEDGN